MSAPRASWPTPDVLLVQSAGSAVQFAVCGGGFPTAIAFTGAGREETVSATDRPWLNTEVDGVRAAPFWRDGYRPAVTSVGEATRVEFRNLRWRTVNGRVLETFRLGLRYEFWPDGTCFVRSFFTVEDTDPPDLKGFRLCPPVSIGPGNEISWAYWERPDCACADIIQALGGIKRNLQAGETVEMDAMVAPFASFDFGVGGCRDKHIEWFMEGSNSLGADPDNVRTVLQWDMGTPHLAWDFLRERRSNPGRPWQWRNQWGWTLCRAPRRRRHPPLRMYHYLDFARRYPSDGQIAGMADEGADLLILHEEWRSDPQDGASPYDEAEFQRVTDSVHRRGMALAVYIRGNEMSVREDGADWFDHLLMADRDGLYMDFGTPICFAAGQDETYPGGRIGFREWCLTMRELRERVGEHGVLLSHSGPFFAACGMTGLIDGYVAGEGERGILLRDRTAHAYFSGLSVAPPTMWTAAFPDYRSPRAVPFLASVGQMPHVTLGTQIESSSLHHPNTPGVVTFARPLWRLWGILHGRHDLEVLHEQNAPAMFASDSAETAACLFETEEGDRLLVIANMAETPREVSTRLCVPASDLRTAIFLNPNVSPPDARPIPVADCFRASLPAYGVAGWLLARDAGQWEGSLERFRRPYPAPSEADRAWLAEIEALRQARFEPAPEERLYVRFFVPTRPAAFEDSIWWDLFDNWNELVRLLPGGEREALGYVSAKGLVAEKPDKADYLWPGVSTPWIALHEVLPPGRHELALCTLHHGEPFYSFVKGEFTADPGAVADVAAFRFANELDDDRSRLTFAVDLLSP